MFLTGQYSMFEPECVANIRLNTSFPEREREDEDID